MPQAAPPPPPPQLQAQQQQFRAPQPNGHTPQKMNFPPPPIINNQPPPPPPPQQQQQPAPGLNPLSQHSQPQLNQQQIQQQFYQQQMLQVTSNSRDLIYMLISQAMQMGQHHPMQQRMNFMPPQWGYVDPNHFFNQHQFNKVRSMNQGIYRVLWHLHNSI